MKLETDKLLPLKAVNKQELKQITFRIGNYAIVKFKVIEDENVWDETIIAEIHPVPNHTDFEPIAFTACWAEFYLSEAKSEILNALALRARIELMKRRIIPDISVTLV